MMEIIPKPAKKLPLWQNILFYFSIALLLITISGYFILDHFLKNSEKTIQDLELRLAREETAEEISLEKEVFSWQKKIGDFSKLIKEHALASNFFIFLEKSCHPEVYFSQVGLKPMNSEAILSGQAENFPVLGQQISILKSKKEIKNLNLSNISIGKKGKADFTLNLLLDPNIFKK
ncbi:MAG: hypothetical protein COX33_00245 [Candidatus Nealsonbacteria bacterium CG23_combo_of_CG06-09_8_20_14_all_36_125]|uniref:PilN domain-containing protein n=2 Tax=Candidatus Nealsoniibacteriota TaxID=1817911 RepID=A0A2G9YZT2_9BACT|nr:MAG: hypothetical protein COX33_00245 [Candidatus Nealsonbacteria bacterium CG23_combo_of_CG06-09_8_20_14_all_36_125]